MVLNAGCAQVCGLPPADVDRACLLLVQAFLAAQPAARKPAGSPDTATHNVRLLLVPGLQPGAWGVVDGELCVCVCVCVREGAVAAQLVHVAGACVWSMLWGCSVHQGYRLHVLLLLGHAYPVAGLKLDLPPFKAVHGHTCVCCAQGLLPAG